MPGEGEVTGLLQAWGRGDPAALDALAPVVHHELRQLARRILAGERAGHDWQPTELVNESYLRLLGWRDVDWQSRRQFYAATARMMRRVLVDAARSRGSLKRGAGAANVPIDGVDPAAPTPALDVLALEEALEAFAVFAPRASQVVELRFFGGFSVDETAKALDVSVRTVINDWNTARAWLFSRLAVRPSA